MRITLSTLNSIFAALCFFSSYMNSADALIAQSRASHSALSSGGWKYSNDPYRLDSEIRAFTAADDGAISLPFVKRLQSTIGLIRPQNTIPTIFLNTLANFVQYQGWSLIFSLEMIKVHLISVSLAFASCVINDIVDVGTTDYQTTFILFYFIFALCSLQSILFYCIR